jgi:ankyrin repeat protein
MNTKKVILLLVVVTAHAALLRGATNDLTSALQKGLFEEEANHDLNAAIRQYQAIAAQFDKDRKLAATAIFRLGECYRKQGNTNDANVQYERVLHEFADQTVLATLSQQNLALLGGTTTATPNPPVTNAARDEQKRLLQEEINFAEQALAAQKELVRNHVADQQSLWSVQRDVLQLKRQLAALDADTPILRDLDLGSNVVTTTEAEEVKRIQGMIKDSPDLINAADEHSRRTPLHDAAERGQLIVAQFLLANGADTTAKDGDGRTPLHLAAAAGHRAMAELLLSKNAPLAVFDHHGNTPLHAAAEKGFKSVVELFLAKGADVNAQSTSGPTPLHLAAANGFRAVVETLLAHGADPNIMVPAVYTSGVNYQGGAPLHISAERGDVAIAELLLTNKARVSEFNGSGFTPLHVAADKGSAEVAKLLLANGADVNVKALGDAYRGWPPIALAVNHNQNELVNLLLARGADANTRFDVHRDPSNEGRLNSPERGFTPLMLAMRKGYVSVAELLLAHQANPNLATEGGTVPLFWACWSHAPDAIKALLEHGADPNARTSQGRTMLMDAAEREDKPAMELLLAHKADVNAQDKRGQTALHVLVNATLNRASGSTAAAELLLSAGAEVNIQNDEGKTPLNYLPRARLTEFQAKMASLLRQHGALDDLPRPDRIEVSRPSSGYASTIVLKGTNAWNHFTLYEVLGLQYEFLSRHPQGENRNSVIGMNYALGYPDLAHVRLRRAGADLKSWQSSPIDLASAIRSGDCSKDPTLAWGDVIEVPELDHPLNESWHGFSAAELDTLQKCLSRQVRVVIKGAETSITLSPSARAAGNAMQVETGASFWIKPVLLNSKLLLASSDLSRVKVTRTDVGTGQKHEWSVDCSESSLAPDLWLRDGDLIEVPEKP